MKAVARTSAHPEGAAALTDQQGLLPIPEHDSDVVIECLCLRLEIGVEEMEVAQVLVLLDLGDGIGDPPPI